MFGEPAVVDNAEIMTTERKRCILVGLSGGVDSAVAAALLRRAGHEIIGVTMRIWPGRGPAPTTDRTACYGPGEGANLEAAARIAEQLGIPWHVIDLGVDFEREVIAHCVREYRAGRTPNPCVLCNRRLKFGLLLDRARSRGVEGDAFATGHYARVECDARTGRMRLRRGLDRRKDQSYFLFGLDQDQLRRLVLPLGELHKADVRRFAAEWGLASADRSESQDFVAGGYASLFTGEEGPGPVLDREGREIGRHRGIIHYTIGQRRGLGVTGRKPLFVTAIDPVRNAIVVGEESALFAEACSVEECRWMAGEPPANEFTCAVKLRSTAREAWTRVVPVGRGRARLRFETPQRAVAPGQAAVFFDGDEVLGGGTIARE